jgi:NADH-quinone oxidoreductase subunit M
VAVVAASGLIVSVVYALTLMQRVFHGIPREETPLQDLNRRELATLVTAMAALAGLGLYPQPVLDISRASMQALQGWYAAPATGGEPAATGVGSLLRPVLNELQTRQARREGVPASVSAHFVAGRAP